jgi:hypothetical protein
MSDLTKLLALPQWKTQNPRCRIRECVVPVVPDKGPDRLSPKDGSLVPKHQLRQERSDLPVYADVDPVELAFQQCSREMPLKFQMRRLSEVLFMAWALSGMLAMVTAAAGPGGIATLSQPWKVTE